MTIAVIYTRVSSAAQLKRGDGLASQETRCREFAAYKGYSVAEVFEDKGVSGGLVDRPGIKAMLSWLRNHRNDAPIVIIDDISRLARDLDAHLKLRAAIGSVGAQLESPSIEFGEDSDSQLIENMLASVSQHHRQKNAEQTRHRMYARMKSGYFCFFVPTGFKYVKGQGGGKVLARDEPTATLLQEALEGYASGRFDSQADVRRFLEPHLVFSRDKDGAIHPQRVKNLLTNKIYAGYYEYKPWGIPLTKGNHPTLISWATFQKIQERLESGTTAPQKRATFDDFPLRGTIACGSCGHPMTGYWAKGRNKRYAYYECFQKGCDARRKSIRRDDAEEHFAELLRALTPAKGVIAIATAMFKDIWDGNSATDAQHRDAQKAKLKGLEAKISKAVDQILDTSSEATRCALTSKIDRFEAQSALIREDLAKTTLKGGDFENRFRTAMDFLASPWKYWENGRSEDRQTVLKLAFEAPIPYCRNRGFEPPKPPYHSMS